jgi:protocatechuate 3,4-dioxygenase beta subunit
MTLARVTPKDPTATVDASYRDRLAARVVDATGQPVEGATVTFAIAAADNGAGASFIGGDAQATALTDTEGRAISPGLIADKTAGEFEATASTAGAASLAFTLTNLAASPYTIGAGAASGTSTVVGTRFDVALAVTVSDKHGNPVKGAVVVFRAPAEGASGSFKRPHKHPSRVARVATNANGIAVAPSFTAGGTAGGFAVTAAVRGTSRSTAFALVVTPR